MRKVLIANRGEIAVRIARACRGADLASVAVYADADRDAVHVQAADEAVPLTGATPAQTYLDTSQVLRAAADRGADAVHPGYGFLAESAGFAQAVLDAGLTWIGPPPSAVRRLGDKLFARQAAGEAGAPLLPAMSVPVSDAAQVAAFAREHGLPVVIKAASGGGGKGVAVARSAAEIPGACAQAMSASAAAGGRAECFAERYLDQARHIEVQCLADSHGGVAVVSTRDCSLQRRHQKVVEEAPAPFLPGGLIAEGAALGPDGPQVRGHAIQFRVYAEDPAHGFAPAQGTVRTWRPPSGPGVRLDSGTEQGSVVTQVFGTLLAKLIVTGASRAEALARARRALHEFEVTGLATSLPLHRALVADEAFAPPDPARPFSVHAGWIGSNWPLSAPPGA